MGFLPKLSDSGPKISWPKPKPKKIMVMSNWLSAADSVPIETPMFCKAGNSASIDKATMDIKDAIKATNSSLDFWGMVCIEQKYWIFKGYE